MERKQDSQEEEERVKSSNITINGDDDHHHDHEVSEKDDDGEGLGILKREISCHSLYGLLVESHLDCLKVCFSLYFFFLYFFLVGDYDINYLNFLESWCDFLKILCFLG